MIGFIICINQSSYSLLHHDIYQISKYIDKKYIWITLLWGTFQEHHSLEIVELKQAVEDTASKTAKRLEMKILQPLNC